MCVYLLYYIYAVQYRYNICILLYSKSMCVYLSYYIIKQKKSNRKYAMLKKCVMSVIQRLCHLSTGLTYERKVPRMRF